MITFARCNEIFADKEKFCKVRKDRREYSYYRVDMQRVSKDGYHYGFCYRLRPNGVNDCAQVLFGKWEPMQSFVVCEIYDEAVLLELIKQCHEVGNF